MELKSKTLEHNRTRRRLLIVLNGIEMRLQNDYQRVVNYLLIVLNGIEMPVFAKLPYLARPFNRTKWN